MVDKNFIYEELIKRGYSKTQAEAKVISGVVDILCEAGDSYNVVKKLEAEIEALEYQKEELIKWHTFHQKKEAEKADKLKRERDEEHKYIEEFYATLSMCDTQEAKDKLKLAQMFRNSIDIDTKYDNTAYIIGLAAILSGGKIAPMDELKKINKHLPIGREL